MTHTPQDTFVSHLIELRNRLVICLIVFIVCLLPLVTPPWFISGKLYDFLAAPMMAALPTGSKMIATGVIAPFFYSVENRHDDRFLDGAAGDFVSGMGIYRAGLIQTRKAFRAAIDYFQHITIFYWHGVLLFFHFQNGI